MMTNEYKKSDIKYYVKKYLIEQKSFFKNKVVVDLPAGNGYTSEVLSEIGAIPKAFDIFPEYFKIEGLKCIYSDITQRIELEDSVADVAICQEGIEHFSDQYKVLKEFNRVLKKEGKLLITTPNYSGIRSRMSYFLSESEHYKKIMPPNEWDSVWMNHPGSERDIYFGHIFLIGAAKLRALAKLSGFKLVRSHSTEKKSTSIIFYFLFIPFIYLANLRLFMKNKRRALRENNPEKIEVYRTLFQININYTLLTQGHLFFEFEKEREVQEVALSLKSIHQEFGRT